MPAARGHGLAQLAAFLRRQRHGLFHEHVFACAQGGQRLRRMVLVARGNQHQVHPRVFQNLFVFRAAVGRAEPQRVALAAHAGSRVDRPQGHPRELLEFRQVFPPGQVAGAYQRHLDSLLGAAGARRLHFAARREAGHGVLLRRRGIAQQHRQASRIRVENGVVGLGRAFESEFVRNQRLHVDAATRLQAQKLLHVAVFSPAHVGQGIVAPLLFVGSVVAAGAIGARHVELNLFQVHVVPGEFQPHGAHYHDASPVAA